MRTLSLALALLLLVAGARADCTAYKTVKNCAATPVTVNQLPPCGNISPEENKIRFVVLGDFGLASGNCEGHVATLVEQFSEQFDGFEFIMTVGDNNYWSGSCETISQNVQQYYGDYYPSGQECVNPSEEQKEQKKILLKISEERSQSEKKTDKLIRFFPSIGNHDWDTYHGKNGLLPYLQHFSFLQTLDSTSDGTYYSVDPAIVLKEKQLQNIVNLFALNSNEMNPWNASSMTTQQSWFKSAIQSSTSAWKLVFFHHSPFTTALHDSPGVWMEWPFSPLGASMVMSGHEHVYERIDRSNITYLVHGLSGHPWLYSLEGCVPTPGSQIRYNGDHGAVYAIATQNQLTMCFYSLENNGTKVDEFTLFK